MPINDILKKAVDYYLTLQKEDGGYYDRKKDMASNRDCAELIPALIYLSKTDAKYRKNLEKSVDFLLKKQSKNGSWNEVLVWDIDGYNKESGLVTAVICVNLLEYYNIKKDQKVLSAVKKAAEYCLSQEIGYGYFRKSERHLADVLNVNANYAAFFYSIYVITKDKRYLEARNRAVFNTLKYMNKDGSFPYTSPILTSPYEYALNVKDINYQGNTLFYLIQAVGENEEKSELFMWCMKKSIEWFQTCIKGKTFKWSKSDLVYSQCAVAAYAYAAYCFNKCGENKKSFEKCIARLEKIQLSNGGFRRYDPTSLSSKCDMFKGALKDIFDTNTVGNYNHAFSVRVNRAYQRLKREGERKKKDADDFYTSQVINCLSKILL